MQSIRVNENTAAFVRFRLIDEDGVPIEGSELTDVRLTLWDIETGSADESPQRGIINDRDNQDVLGGSSPYDAEGVEYQGDGYIRWTLTADDNIIVTRSRQIERHRARLVFTWPSGQYAHELEIEVMNQGQG